MDKGSLLNQTLDLLDFLNEKEKEVTKAFGEGSIFLVDGFDLVDALLRQILEVGEDNFWSDIVAEWIFGLYLEGGTTREKLLDFLLNIDTYQEGFEAMNQAILSED